ncbi:HdeD family acid-resistance protein [Haloarchaeobius sp. DFWS5]|uniref:HdeD family acid-resistance protein n=1 Tax=Haloarchaeobius sp. DFWS5 TaxID=3446114 RepID=UPI003EC10A8B
MSSKESTGVYVEPLKKTLGDDWEGLMIVGVSTILLGVIAVFVPALTSLFLSLLFGAALILGGVLQIGHATGHRDWKGALSQLLLGTFFVLAGVFLMANPQVGIVSVTFAVAGVLFFSGVFELLLALSILGDDNWLLFAVSGIVSVVLSVFAFLQFPSSAAWALGLLFGLGLISSGVAAVLVANGARKTAKSKVEPPVAGPRGA